MAEIIMRSMILLAIEENDLLQLKAFHRAFAMYAIPRKCFVYQVFYRLVKPSHWPE